VLEVASAIARAPVKVPPVAGTASTLGIVTALAIMLLEPVIVQFSSIVFLRSPPVAFSMLNVPAAGFVFPITVPFISDMFVY
jgi:hypothetical protein